MTTSELTRNFRVPIPNRDKRFWHPEYKAGMTIFDAVLAKYIAVNQFLGVWDNSTSYVVGDTVLDIDNGGLYQCIASHTSTATGTFESDRVANPTYWFDATFSVRERGEWMHSTVYNRGDFVVSGAIYAMCIEPHTSTSTGTIDDVNNSSNWSFLIDATDTVDAINNQLFRQVKTIGGAHIITNADKNNLLVYNGTGDTWDIDATALDDAFEFAVVNYGNGSLSIDPVGSQTVDLQGNLYLDGQSSAIVTRQSSSEFRTISKTYHSYTQNTVLAGPATGGFGNVGMRALTVNDLPKITVDDKSAGYVVSNDDYGKVIRTTTAVTVSLPASPAIGFYVYAVNEAATPTTVDTTGAPLINGAASIELAQYDAGMFVFNGTNYMNVIPAAPVIPPSTQTIEVISSNDTITNADKGTLFIASANVTFAIDAIAGLDSDWYVDIMRDGDYDDLGYVIVNPNASEEIDLQLQIIGYGGERFRVFKRGSEFRTDRVAGLVCFGEATMPSAQSYDFYTASVFYDDPEIVGGLVQLSGIDHNDTASYDLRLQANVAGSVDTSGNNYMALRAQGLSTSTITGGGSNTNQVDLYASAPTGTVISGRIEFDIHRGLSVTTGRFTMVTGDITQYPLFGAFAFNGGEFSGFRLANNSSRTLTGGTARMYGIRARRP